MGQFTLCNDFPGDYTLISNYFLDVCMPQANGEFVKVYLYLLRNATGVSASLELSSIADIFNCTENDVLRALKYWHKSGVLDLKLDEQGNLNSVRLLPVGANLPQASTSAANIVSTASTSTEIPTGSEAVSSEPAKPSSLSAEIIRALTEREDVIQILFVAEQYLGKALSPIEINKLLYFYDELHFSTDLMEYLIEYCVSKGSHSIRYIETVALSWADQNITTIEQAKAATTAYNKNYFAILRAFGIKNRNPIDEEIRYMNVWLDELGFSLEIISLACSKAVMATGQPNFPYADSILRSWQKRDVHDVADVEKLEDSHKQAKAAKNEAPAPRAQSSASRNKFNNFHQRAYNVNELEKLLLNK